ncbi:hypothetical protein [Paenibacillus sp. sgz5001063]|uniref:hypothetical protein n=1 Tax=Paenibacillus sp. sgz5001063 TaxID=3242474 RepID=UPI0036D383C7
MKNKILFLICIVILLPMLSTKQVQATNTKVYLELSKGVTYYGEVKNGKPNGKGSMDWGGKSYSGDWIDGKRSGQGYYKFNEIVDTDTTRTITYNGSWKNDKKHGKGLLKEITSGEYGPSLVQQGIFNNNQFINGYETRFFLGYYDFDYIDQKQAVGFGTNSKELARKLLSGNFSGEQASNIHIYKKTGKYYEGYSFAYEPESSGSNYSIGTYEKITENGSTSFVLRSGVHNSGSDGDDFYTQETYKDGIIVKKKSIYQPDEYYATLDKNLKNKLKEMKPYLKGFSNAMREL